MRCKCWKSLWIWAKAFITLHSYRVAWFSKSPHQHGVVATSATATSGECGDALWTRSVTHSFHSILSHLYRIPYALPETGVNHSLQGNLCKLKLSETANNHPFVCSWFSWGSYWVKNAAQIILSFVSISSPDSEGFLTKLSLYFLMCTWTVLQPVTHNRTDQWEQEALSMFTWPISSLITACLLPAKKFMISVMPSKGYTFSGKMSGTKLAHMFYGGLMLYLELSTLKKSLFSSDLLMMIMRCLNLDWLLPILGSLMCGDFEIKCIMHKLLDS